MASKATTARSSDLTRLIGRNVKAGRTQLGLTQNQLAELLGLDTLTISRLETGVQMPSIERLNDLATALQTSLPILVTDQDKIDVFDGLLAATIKDLPLREKEFVFAFAVQYAQHWRAGVKSRTDS